MASYLFLTDVLYSVIPHQREESAAGYRVRRSSLGRTSRAVLGGGLTINTLPNNMTHVVVRASPQCFFSQ